MECLKNFYIVKYKGLLMSLLNMVYYEKLINNWLLRLIYFMLFDFYIYESYIDINFSGKKYNIVFLFFYYIY